MKAKVERTTLVAGAPGVGEVGGSSKEEFRDAVRSGLAGRPKRMSSRWLYDDRGSRIFEAIMALPEYYLSRCEARILESQAAGILSALQAHRQGASTPIQIVDLGAGNGAKAKILLRTFRKARALERYVPIDVSEAALDSIRNGFQEEFPLHAIQGDWIGTLSEAEALPHGPKLVLFLGSNIGNFEYPEALAFLSSIRSALAAGDALFIGFDLRKHPHAILRAYSDAEGVTARFNLNLLERINRELGGRFRSQDFLHRAEYHALPGVVRSFLIARTSLEVPIAGADMVSAFRAGEAIHTESAFKYSLPQIEAMARAAGFAVKAHFHDPWGAFADSLWTPAAPRVTDQAAPRETSSPREPTAPREPTL